MKKKKFEKSIDDEIEQLLKKYINLTERPQETQTKEMDYLYFKEEAQELKEKINDVFEMFKPILIDNIIKTGKKAINNCRNLINSLGDLSEALDSIDEDISVISFFQAYMVKEIGEILGFNLKEMNKEVKVYLNKMKDNIDDMDVSLYYNKNKAKGQKIKIDKDTIEKELKEELKKSDHDFIMQLAKKFNKIRENEIKNQKISSKKIDRMMTDGICIICRDYLIKELKKSQGLFFWKNYLNICKKLKSDLKTLKSKEDWVKKEMKIIKK
jgi:hypothetical protein